MPVRKLLKRQASPHAGELRDRLVEEWKARNSSADQPVILEENLGQNQPRHVYVVWDDWRSLGGIERSEIIMDAYEAVHGRKKSLQVTVAMGLTTDEAQRMGIHYN